MDGADALSVNLMAGLGLAWRCSDLRRELGRDDERLQGGREGSHSEGERAALRLDERPWRWRESDGSGVCLNDSVKLGHSSARC